MTYKGICIFQRLCPDKVVLMTAGRGKTIYMQEQDASFIYHLHEGLVAGVRVTEEGHEITDIIVPNQFIGLVGFLNMYEARTRTHLGEARAITPVTYCRVRREVVWDLMDDREARARIVHTICSGTLSRGILAASPLKNDVANRIIHILQMLAQSIGTRTDGDFTVIQNISHGDFALVANTTRSTVTRILDKLETIGIIKVNLRQIVVPSRRKLFELTSFSKVEDILHSLSN
jgi:CRP-like cAMP-binding protein